ncbi:MAG: hypothetical protein NUV72_05065 [Bauldia sp.]|nr:hypothetical protein [Bauldia sp.]
MAFIASRLHNLTGLSPGRNTYRLDVDGSVDDVDDVEAAGYINNKDDNQDLAIGDRLDVYEWSAVPFAADSTLTNALQLIVTNVIANDAAASAGNVNMAQVFLTTSLFSSGT